MKRYSRLASVEERKNMKKAYFYIFFSIISIVFLIFFGLPLLIKFAGFVGEVAKSDKPVEISDTTPPAPPQFDNIPEYVSSDSLDITGTSESGAVIIFNTNNNTSEVVANNEGKFSLHFNLEKGENTISAIAKDTAGNKSMESKVYRITQDNLDPEITIDSPQDGVNLYGVGQRQLSIKGKVSEKVDLKINDKFVFLKDDNTFNYTTTLNEGENKFEIKATDPAGNENSSSLTVNFSL